MRGLFYSILHSKVISGPLFKEVVYQCHASFCEIAYGVLVGGKPMCRWDITGAEFMKRKIFLFSLITFVLALAIAGCQREGCTDPKATNYDPDAKKDNGTCVYAEPEPTPVEPTKVITMDFDWRTPFNTAINLKEIKNLTDQPDVKNVCMNLVYTEESTMGESSNYPTRAFHIARDSLQKRFDISPKVIGSGTIIVHSEGGAQQPSVTEGTGMALEDSIWYASKGFAIKRFDASTMKK